MASSISKQDLQDKLLEMKRLIHQQQQIQSSLLQQQTLQVRPFSFAPMPVKDGEGVSRLSPSRQKESEVELHRVEDEKNQFELRAHKYLNPTISETRASKEMTAKSPSMHNRSNSLNEKAASAIKTRLTPVNLEKKNFDSRRSDDRKQTMSPPPRNNEAVSRSGSPQYKQSLLDDIKAYN